MSNQVEAEIEKFKREMLAARKLRLGKKQIAFFNRIYPKGVPEKSLISAIDLCDRTLKKNADDPQGTAGDAEARKFYKTVVTYEVLSEEPLGRFSLAMLHEMCTDGPCIGRFRDTVTREIGGKKVVSELLDFGGEPKFFGLDDNGKEVG